MYNPKAVQNIVSAHVDKLNSDSNFYPKAGLYTLAVVAFFVLNSYGHSSAGWWVSLAIALLTLVGLGIPRYVWDEDIQGDLVPDAVYMAINSSKAIEPGLREAIQYSLTPELKVRDLIAVESKYHEDKKITSRPGYRGLKQDEPDTN
jgi:hypothetical protein